MRSVFNRGASTVNGLQCRCAQVTAAAGFIPHVKMRNRCSPDKLFIMIIIVVVIIIRAASLVLVAAPSSNMLHFVTYHMLVWLQWLQSLGDIQIVLRRLFSSSLHTRVKIKALSSSRPEEGSLLTAASGRVESLFISLRNRTFAGSEGI